MTCLIIRDFHTASENSFGASTRTRRLRLKNLGVSVTVYLFSDRVFPPFEEHRVAWNEWRPFCSPLTIHIHSSVSITVCAHKLFTLISALERYSQRRCRVMSSGTDGRSRLSAAGTHTPFYRKYMHGHARWFRLCSKNGFELPAQFSYLIKTS